MIKSIRSIAQFPVFFLLNSRLCLQVFKN